MHSPTLCQGSGELELLVGIALQSETVSVDLGGDRSRGTFLLFGVLTSCLRAMWLLLPVTEVGGACVEGAQARTVSGGVRGRAGNLRAEGGRPARASVLGRTFCGRCLGFDVREGCVVSVCWYCWLVGSSRDCSLGSCRQV